jgi:hypothetical protein
VSPQPYRIGRTRSLEAFSSGLFFAQGCTWPSGGSSSFHPYSPSCLEEEFYEVHLQDPAYPGLSGWGYAAFQACGGRTVDALLNACTFFCGRDF